MIYRHKRLEALINVPNVEVLTCIPTEESSFITVSFEYDSCLFTNTVEMACNISKKEYCENFVKIFNTIKEQIEETWQRVNTDWVKPPDEMCGIKAVRGYEELYEYLTDNSIV